MFRQKLSAVIMAAGLGSLVSIAPDRAIMPTFAWPSFTRAAYSRGKGRKTTAKPTGAAEAQREATKRRNQRKRAARRNTAGGSRKECWL